MKRYVIVDIDGTVSDPGHRVHYMNKKSHYYDESKFYENCHKDTPKKDIIELVNALETFYTIIFCTGRIESTRQKTEKWLSQYVGVWTEKCKLLMKSDGEGRHDTEVKPELLREAGISFDDILIVIEDRNSVVEEWRRLGITCVQPELGDF